ncbi:MAG: hypothetical protein D6718_13935 [Acidobacteria bacterium]|nr:MAG: hypothetical protein D6718_13935 [Acidobacteriota bacterium]
MRPLTFRSLAAASALAAATGAWASTVPLDPVAPPGWALPDGVAQHLPDRVADALGPFHLRLGASVPEVERIVPMRKRGFLRAGDDVYLHAVVGDLRSAATVPAPAGLTVLEGDLYFRDGGELVEASLILSADQDAERAIEALETLLGEPRFEVVMPGALELAIGWQAGDGYLLATFTDLSIFRVHAFRNEPQDLLAGTHVMLFEGLERYARRLAAGEPQEKLAEELGQVLAWVRMARRVLGDLR